MSALRRWGLFAAALAASAVVSAALWMAGVPAFLLLLFPFVLVPRRRGAACPQCGKRGRRGESYCPADGTALQPE